MKYIKIASITACFMLILIPLAFADVEAPKMPQVEISETIGKEGAETVAEERLCPELPVCPEPKPCPETVGICPIEGKQDVDFKAHAADSRRYIDFLRKEVYFYLEDGAGSKVLGYLVSELDRYYFTYRDVPGTEEALYLKARIYAKWRKYEHELVCLLKILYEYPEGAFHKKARTDAMDLLSGKLKRDLPDSPEILAGGRGKSRADDQAAMLEAFVRFSDSDYLELQMNQLGEFLSYYPRHRKSDLMMTFWANSYIRMKNYEAAAHTLRRLAAFYPESPMRPESLYMLGLVYSENLRKYQAAVDVFLQIIEVHPDSSQAVSSHERAAELYDKKLKSPEMAVEMLEAITATYPGTDAAHRAFNYMADIHEDARRYREAFDAFRRQAVMFAEKPDIAVTAMYEVGRVALKRLKDNGLYVETMLDTYRKYPRHERSAEALYEAAGMYEKKLEDMKKAKKYYRMVFEEFPSDKRAGPARKKLDSILAREMKEELRRQRELEKQKGAK
jgi:TolA-binding protein